MAGNCLLNMANNERVTKAVSITEDVVQWVEEQANAENRSFSNYVETLLIRIKADAELANVEREACAS